MRVVHCLKCHQRMIRYGTGQHYAQYRCQDCNLVVTTYDAKPNQHKAQIAREADRRYPHFIDQPGEVWSEESP